jgi:hypothetical protein
MPTSTKSDYKNLNRKYFTRSVTRQFMETYNFDESSKEWNKNKIKKNNCYYTYINYE